MQEPSWGPEPSSAGTLTRLCRSRAGAQSPAQSPARLGHSDHAVAQEDEEDAEDGYNIDDFDGDDYEFDDNVAENSFSE